MEVLVSYYKDYIESVCPELKSWQVKQICVEMDSRDAKLIKEREKLE
jgi:hypothetical protein